MLLLRHALRYSFAFFNGQALAVWQADHAILRVASVAALPAIFTAGESLHVFASADGYIHTPASNSADGPSAPASDCPTLQSQGVEVEGKGLYFEHLWTYSGRHQ